MKRWWSANQKSVFSPGAQWASTMILAFLASRTVGKKICCLNHLAYSILLQQPELRQKLALRNEPLLQQAPICVEAALELANGQKLVRVLKSMVDMADIAGKGT